MKTITIAGQKGGIGKTTLTFNLGAALVRAKKKVLLIDMDSQGNLSKHALPEYTDSEHEQDSVAEIVKYGAEWPDVMREVREGFSIVPAGSRLRELDEEIAEINLSFFESSFDFVLFDCPPAMGPRTIAAVVSADEVIVPAEAASFSFDGVRAINRSLQTLGKKMSGIVINKFSPRLRVARHLIEDFQNLAADIDTKLYNSYIRNSVAIVEAQLQQQDIFTYDEESAAASDFANLAVEVIRGNG
jgi:chromosome partitioning protein